MSDSGLWSVSVRVNSGAEEAVADLLAQLFGQNASIYTEFDTGVTSVTVYTEHEPSGWRVGFRAGISRIRATGLEPGTGRVSVRKVRREDWAESWKRHFPPMEVGTALLVRPSWSRRRPRKGQRVLVLDPGLSFGTGQHPTTAFCLRQVVTSRKAGQSQSFLDIGTGSGILALAAAKLGYEQVAGFDFDPVAVRIAQANARRNRVGARVRFFHADVTRFKPRQARRYSMVCANLMANLLLDERRRIVACVADAGRLVLAGILTREFAQVQAAYEAAGLRLVASRREGEWRSGCFARPGGIVRRRPSGSAGGGR